jgi:hypothetical protein
VSFGDLGLFFSASPNNGGQTGTSLGLGAVTVGMTNVAFVPIEPSASSTTGRLNVSKEGDSVVLSWPAAGAFVLEAGESVEGPFSSDAVGAPVSAGGTNSVTIPISARQQFYRLRATSN